jgi:ribonuclease I
MTKQIPNTRYELSIDGTIRNTITGRIMKQTIDRCQRPGKEIRVVCLENRRFNVHILMAELFLLNSGNMRYVRFKSDDTLDVSPSNLQWSSKSDCITKTKNKYFEGVYKLKHGEKYVATISVLDGDKRKQITSKKFNTAFDAYQHRISMLVKYG